MTGKKTPGFDEARYEELLVRFHPRPITSSAAFDQAQAVIDELVARRSLTPEEDAILNLVTTLVEEWERDSIHIPAVEPREVIRFLLENGGHRQKDLVPIFGTESLVSEVLSGKRDLQRRHIAGLSTFFHVSPAAFFGDLETSAPLAALTVGVAARSSRV